MLRPMLLLLHLSGVIVWVGGMFFAYFCLRPAAARVLDPPLRLPLWVATFGSFLPITAAAVVAIVGSGITMLAQVGMQAAPVGWHVMLALGLLMAAVFVRVWAVLYPRLRRQCASSSWPAAAATLNAIRRMVALNLVLSVCVVVAALSAR